MSSPLSPATVFLLGSEPLGKLGKKQEDAEEYENPGLK
jgi:hypothetical protein